MSHEKEIGLVLTDFVKVYNHFEKPASVEEGLYIMNGGWCGVVASMCAYVAKARFNIEDINICSNALHIYIGYKGKDYDTLYPGGYNATKEWLLKEVGESDRVSCDPVGEEVNKGYYDWGFVYIFKAMSERWGVPLPSYFSRYEAGAESMANGADVKARKRQMENAYHSALKIPLATSVKHHWGVRPFTWYEHIENEDGFRHLDEINWKRSADLIK